MTSTPIVRGNLVANTIWTTTNSPLRKMNLDIIIIIILIILKNLWLTFLPFMDEKM